MLENARLNLLYQKFVIAQEIPEDELANVTLEELSFIYAASEAAKKDERFKSIHFPIRQQIIYWAAVDALKKAEAIYVAYTKLPPYPYIDPGAGAWIFSAEDIAKKLADDVAKKQHLELVIRKIDNKMILPLFAQLYYYGVERAIIDNGSHPMIVKRSDILPDPEPRKNEDGTEEHHGEDFKNQAIQLSMIQFFQYMQIQAASAKADAAAAESGEELTDEAKEAQQKRKENSQKILKMMEGRMLGQLVEGKFLIPVVTLVDGKPLPPGQTAPSGENVSRRIANLMDNNKVTWLPAFTDWPEFAKTYKPTEWGAVVMDYEHLVKLAQDAKINRIVLNARGCSFRMDEKLIENVETFRQKKAEFDAKRAEEAAEKGEPLPEKKAEKPAAAPVKTETKAGDVVYGELKDSPDMMIGALKRSAKALKTVKYMWLASRTQGSEKGYLLVAEFTGDVAEGKEELKRASAGYLDGKILEIREADEEAMKLVESIKPFYKKGLFG